MTASHVLRYFERDGLPDHLAWIGSPFRDLATELADRLPDGPELEAGLRKLLEARDCAVRATDQGPVEPEADAFSKPDGPIGEGVRDVGALLAMKKHAAVVYFIRNGNRVKIGTTQSLRSRITRLSLRPEDLVRVEHGGVGHERCVHARFGAHRIGTTEWFDLRGPLADHIAKRETNQERVRNALAYYGEMRRRDLEVLIGITEKQALKALDGLKPGVERTDSDTWRLVPHAR
ncbi:GIY-YIG nuclease family protein [Streptomyces europaeiscabiei]|uniref:GIY-YIG nuclease family protein n=1 Tax=Streptomyces europaeiscabiei TaxID=146819 RepID=UPI0029BECE88|nr:GIY-YIG nuclease family protein [Streptomyces europaeiscabiei]MDX3582516.1 GIY-YIG nuclease family protein [Streptomyces europaeiscabiei]